MVLSDYSVSVRTAIWGRRAGLIRGGELPLLNDNFGRFLCAFFGCCSSVIGSAYVFAVFPHGQKPEQGLGWRGGYSDKSLIKDSFSFQLGLALAC